MPRAPHTKSRDPPRADDSLANVLGIIEDSA
jgi:hypothetical protein